MSFDYLSGVKAPARSTQIMADFLIMEVELKDVKKFGSLRIGVGSYALGRLREIANVYNENVEHINKEVSGYTPKDFQSTWEYFKEHPHPEYLSEVGKQRKVDEYEKDKILAEQRELERKNEVSQLRQLIPTCGRLKEKIERVCNLAKMENPKLASITVDAGITPMLRMSKERRAEVSKEVVEPKKVFVNVVCDAGYGNSLGFAHGPEWNKPVVFSFDNGKWYGSVPANVEGKFVLVNNGAIVKWEDGENHVLMGSETSKFS